jgi:hypothetical protein
MVGRHREDGRQEGIKEVNSQEKGLGDSPDKRSVLALLADPGCPLCREERKAEDLFFVWYVIEKYSELECLERVEKSLGFCKRHTRALFSWSGSGIVAYLYHYLIEAALDRLADAERVLSTADSWESVKLDLMSESSCPVCATMKENSVWTVSLIRRTWRDPEVRCALEGQHSFDLMHILQVSSLLSWDELSFFITLMQDRLAESKRAGAPRSDESLVAVIWGTSLKGNDSVWKDETQNPVGDRCEMSGFGREEAWSPTLAELRRSLREPGCSICRAEKKALQGYYGWLSSEIKSTPPYHWSDAIWLCREHVLDFLRVGEEAAVSRLAEAVRDYWLIELEKLRIGLEDKPEDSVIHRAVGAARRLRKQVASGKDLRAWRSFQHHFIESVKYLCQSPKSVLVELRERWLRTHPCPACTCAQTAAERAGDLLARGLEDAGTRSVYCEGSGVCFHHLPLALEFAASEDVRRVLFHSQRVRLEVLAWELSEFDRKYNWSVRYENKGLEQSAWERAVAQYSGILAIS